MPIRILIADDNEIMRSRIVEMLGSHEGWTICAAVQDGHEAAAKALELKPDVIILDLAMPMLDGLSATREILRTLPTVPILIYTLHSIPAIELEAKKAGARKLVLKPHIELLIRAMEEILANQSGEAAQVPAPTIASSTTNVTPVAIVAEDAIANQPQDHPAESVSAAAPAAASASASAVASAAAGNGAETKAVAADGDSATPPAMAEPQLPSS
jgi:DNA-binding NarL/FixJ family response regulator